MKVLIDTNILIDLALDREPFSIHAGMVFDLLQTGSVRSYTAWHSISNFYSLTVPLMKDQGARDFIRELCTFVNIAPVTTKDIQYSVRLKMNDFEDAMQAAAAVACGADFIITRNVKDYKGSPVEAVAPEVFLKKEGR